MLSSAHQVNWPCPHWSSGLVRPTCLGVREGSGERLQQTKGALGGWWPLPGWGQETRGHPTVVRRRQHRCQASPVLSACGPDPASTRHPHAAFTAFAGELSHVVALKAQTDSRSPNLPNPGLVGHMRGAGADTIHPSLLSEPLLPG